MKVPGQTMNKSQQKEKERNRERGGGGGVKRCTWISMEKAVSCSLLGSLGFRWRSVIAEK